jgi:tetratricopeptide (TPR) repeat protein
MSQRSKKRRLKQVTVETTGDLSGAAPPMREGQSIAPGTARGLHEIPHWKVAGVCALLVIAVFIVFGQTIGHGFFNFDDGEYVYNNPLVTRGLSIQRIGWAFTHAIAANWHPLTMIVHMLDCQVYGLWAGGHHLTNVILHAACAVMLFLLLLEITGALWRSGFVAAVFAIHPLRVESVAWVAELKDVLSGLFFMLALWAYTRYACRRQSAGRYAMIVLWLALGLMSKPMLVTTPFVLLLLDYWPLGRLQKISQLPGLLREKIPLFALSALSSVATVLAQQRTLEPIGNFPLSERIGNGLVAYVAYLGKLIYPSQLAVLYPLSADRSPAWQVMDALLFLTAMTGGAYVLRRKQPFILAGWLWYLGMLVPVIGILKVGQQAYADRYTYLPQIGLCIGATWAAADWAGQRRGRRLALGCAAVAIPCALMVVAYRQATYWRDSETLWIHTLACTENNYVGHNNLGVVLIDQGKPREAIAQYVEAVRINPRYADVRNNLGNAMLQQGQVEEAVAQYREALRINPAYTDAHYDLGNALVRQGKQEAAVAEYEEALRLNPYYADAVHTNLGNAFLQQGKPEEAIAQYGEALRINPAYAGARNDLGYALFRQGRPEEAMAQYVEALRIDPTFAGTHNNFGDALVQQGRLEEGIAQYREALRLDPANENAHINLGNAMIEKGESGGAIAEMQKALDLQPANPSFQNKLAWILATAAQSSVRDGARAVKLAEQASQSAGGNDPDFLRTLAAAYAQAGESSRAVQTAGKALQLAEAKASAALAGHLRREIELYRAGHAF